MIDIKIEESEAFDRLSILEVKRTNSNNDDLKNSLLKQSADLESSIVNSISFDTYSKIFYSDEFTELHNVNSQLFELFNKCKLGGIDAKIPDELNFKRHLAKKALQKRFFGKDSIEVKLGY